MSTNMPQPSDAQAGSSGDDRKRGRRGGRRDRDSGDKTGARGGYIDRTVQVRRCAAVVKGGRRFSFAALVVVGDTKGRVGYGYGKANEVPPAVEKATKQAQRNMLDVPLTQGSIPHWVEGRFGTCKVRLLPAGPGTGVIAGSVVRAVCEALGVTDILTKAYGSNNPMVVLKATVNALKQLRTKQDIERLRGVALS